MGRRHPGTGRRAARGTETHKSRLGPAPTRHSFAAGVVRGICACALHPHWAIWSNWPVLCGGAIHACVSRSHFASSGIAESPWGADWCHLPRPLGVRYEGMLTKRVSQRQVRGKRRISEAARGPFSGCRVLRGRWEAWLLLSPGSQFVVPWGDQEPED